MSVATVPVQQATIRQYAQDLKLANRRLLHGNRRDTHCSTSLPE